MIWIILFFFISIGITVAIGINDGWWGFDDYILMYLFTSVITAFTLFLIGLIVEGAVLPSVVDEKIVEEYREELCCVSSIGVSDNGVYFIDYGNNKYSYTVYEETKGYINKELNSAQVYFLEVEPGDTPHLSSYRYDWGNDKLNTLFTNSHSHYTFYIPAN